MTSKELEALVLQNIKTLEDSLVDPSVIPFCDQPIADLDEQYTNASMKHIIAVMQEGLKEQAALTSIEKAVLDIKRSAKGAEMVLVIQSLQREKAGLMPLVKPSK